MAVQISTYTGLQTAVTDWLARSGDAELLGRFDDFLTLCERRMYYGYATDDPSNPMRSDPLRIVDMETVNSSFALLATTSQPTGFLELISAALNSPLGPMQIVSQRVIDAYASSTPNQPYVIAVSGTNFRIFPNPGTGSYTATLRYYQKLATPAGSTVNAILTGSPDVYLYGCLVEAAIYTQGKDEAMAYLAMYNASVQGLNARTNRITASANPVIRIRGGMIV